MRVKDLIALLKTYDGNAPVVISGAEKGFGADFEIDGTHQFDDSPEVRLIPGAEAE